MQWHMHRWNQSSLTDRKGADYGFHNALAYIYIYTYIYIFMYIYIYIYIYIYVYI